jgi:hypothetical protein
METFLQHTAAKFNGKKFARDCSILFDKRLDQQEIQELLPAPTEIVQSRFDKSTDQQ